MSLKQRAEKREQGVTKHSLYFKLDPRLLKIEAGFNARIMTDDLREYIDQLKIDILAGAIFPAIDIRSEGDDAYVVDGHCRTTAYHELIAEGHHEILTVDVREFRGNNVDRVFHMLGTAKRKQLSTLEQGIGYLKLVNFGWSRADIADRAKKSPSHVDQALTLAMANSDVQMLVATEQVPGRVAIAAIKEHGHAAGPFLQALLDKSKKGRLTQKSFTGPSLPRKLVDRCESTIKTLFTPEAAERLKQIVEESPEEAVIDVPMSMAQLKELLAAQHDIAKARAKDTMRATLETEHDER